MTPHRFCVTLIALILIPGLLPSAAAHGKPDSHSKDVEADDDVNCITSDEYRYGRETNLKDTSPFAVKVAIPGIGSTKCWMQGKEILGTSDPKLTPGTAIATFVDGMYKGHAAIFVRYDVKDGRPGIFVIHQWKDHTLRETMIYFDFKRTSPNNANAYSVIERY